MRSIFAGLLLAWFTVAGMSGPVYAKGCLKGAAVGGVAGHMAGHHTKTGALAGCAIGHHHANKVSKQQAQQNASANQNTTTR